VRPAADACPVGVAAEPRREWVPSFDGAVVIVMLVTTDSRDGGWRSLCPLQARRRTCPRLMSPPGSTKVPRQPDGSSVLVAVWVDAGRAVAWNATVPGRRLVLTVYAGGGRDLAAAQPAHAAIRAAARCSSASRTWARAAGTSTGA
jgi:hypothetical protein